MAAWLIPALKQLAAVLPHVGMIISAATPVFTKKKVDAAANQMQLLQEQIGELQAAASQNSAHIKELAAQLQSTVAALEEAAALAEAKLRRALLFCLAATVLSALSLCVGLFLVFAR
jgi:multidrug resistance efflux pump